MTSWRASGRWPWRAYSSLKDIFLLAFLPVVCSLDDDDDELEGIYQAALEGAQQSRRPDAVRSADLSALVRCEEMCLAPLPTGMQYHLLSRACSSPTGPTPYARQTSPRW